MTIREIVYINGAFCPLEEAKIPIDDRGFLYGDGLFTSMRVADERILFLESHLKRLKEQCLLLHIIPPDLDPDLLMQLLEHNQAQKGLWKMKIVITGGSGRELALPSRRFGQVIATVRPLEKGNKAVRLSLYSKPIDRSAGLLKTISYVDRLMLKQEALDRGYEDGISTLRDGTLLEASSSNVFWKVGKVVYTPHRGLPLLSGLGLEHVLERLGGLGWKVEGVQCGLGGIPTEANVYVVNSVRGVSGVSEIEGRQFKRDRDFEALVDGLFV